MCRYEIHTDQARATGLLDAGIAMPAPIDGGC